MEMGIHVSEFSDQDAFDLVTVFTLLAEQVQHDLMASGTPQAMYAPWLPVVRHMLQAGRRFVQDHPDVNWEINFDVEGQINRFLSSGWLEPKRKGTEDGIREEKGREQPGSSRPSDC